MLGGVFKVPISLDPHFANAPLCSNGQTQPMRGREFVNVLKNRSGYGNITIGEIAVNGERVELASDGRMTHNSLKFRGKEKLSVRLGIEQRLFANTVSGEQQRSRVFVPERKCKHAAQGFDTVHTILLITVQNDFGVARGGK